MVGGIEQLMGAVQQPMLFVRGIGLAVPCPVPASGVITMAANIEIDAPALKEALQARCPHALVRYVNDANAAAMGEVWRGSAQGHRSMVMVTIGTGLGGGVVVNGDVIDGAFGAGGEIGHICAEPGRGARVRLRSARMPGAVRLGFRRGQQLPARVRAARCRAR